ncbi:membrane protein AbrB duplication [Segniliparus rotundus DSM 44985]|uniref:Membrane protein AbrB duplication n=1 Tax=Segniliparus rotundus (strain ATCC BAA-972 / CDC 1076 / CIP 108378 / DSM 44985 / JCM 13578) TaxID=640132 RepID=D6ZBE4_SEGRD|nr:AbrB family transcriptional regulator [Segniliparus rotundus]ADG98896.1 membrane protein AbrB duplication [Segniliparus rotundus DSM 44985]
MTAPPRACQLGCIPLVALLGFAANAVSLPGAWLVAAIVGAAAGAVWSRTELAPPALAMSFAQGVVAVDAARPLSTLSREDFGHYAGVSAFSITLTLSLSVLFGLLLARLAKDLSPATAGLSVIAGGASAITSMARELGADQRYVTLSQYLRLIVVVGSMPLMLGLLSPGFAAPAGETAGHQWSWPGIAGAAALICAGTWLARRAKTPAPALLGPLAAATALGLLWPEAMAAMGTPALVTNAAYAVIGWQAGGGLCVASLRRFVRLLPLTLLFILLMIGVCLLVALVVARWTGVPLTDAYLATTPGGIYGVLAVANQTGAGPLVTMLQVLRMIIMLLAAGSVPYITRRIQTRITQKSAHAQRAKETAPCSTPISM